MTRIASLALFVAAVASLAVGPARAELPVAPPPREVRPDGTRDPAPKPEPPAPGENPAVTVERIIKNSKAVAEKLAQPDTGTETRKTQDKILSDIDSLIDRQENPPPKSDDKNKEQDKDKEKNKDDMPDPKMNPDMMKMGDPKTGEKPMDKGMGMQDPMPMAGMNDPPPMGGRKPRMGDPMNDDKKNQGQAQKNQQKQPTGKEQQKDPGGMTAGNPGGKVPARPALPFDDDVAKDVWGHLPDKLRQQMTQYYKEDVMPRYSELLRLYYSSLAEKGTRPNDPKR
jgi:hypothetical protein